MRMRVPCGAFLVLVLTLAVSRALADDVVPYTFNVTNPVTYASVMTTFKSRGLNIGYWASFTADAGGRLRLRLALPPTGQETACCLPGSCMNDLQTVKEWAPVQGGLLLIRRGECLFHNKMLVAQNFGAAGAVVINDDDSPLLMAGSPDLPEPNIPGFAIGRTLGDFLEVTVEQSAASVWVEVDAMPSGFPMIGYVMTTAGTVAVVLCLLVPCLLCCRARSNRGLGTNTPQERPGLQGSFSDLQAPIVGVPLQTVPLSVHGIPIPPPDAPCSVSRTGSMSKGAEASYALPHSEFDVTSAAPIMYGPLVEPDSNPHHQQNSAVPRPHLLEGDKGLYV